MQQYLEIIGDTIDNGVFKGDRTGTGTTSKFGMQKRFALHKLWKAILPTVTTKFTHTHSIEHELFWMLSGDTRLEYLIANKVRIWNEWVLKGTEVWATLTFDELYDYLEKKWSVSVTYVNSDAPYKLIDQDPAKKYLEISTQAYNDATDITNYELISAGRAEELSYEHLRRIYRVVEGKEPQRLIGGDLGPVYGKTWRNIEDVRIIPKLQWHLYEAKGFEFVVDLPGEDYTKDRCVIQRRVDQVAELLDMLSHEPEQGDKGKNRDSRRLIICAWDPCLIEDQALPPCHAFIQFWTRKLTLEERLEAYRAQDEQRIQYQAEKEGVVERGSPIPSTIASYVACLQLWRKDTVTVDDVAKEFDQLKVPTRAISCGLYQRSADTFLGVPFNITFYCLMTHMLANQFNMVAEEFVWTGGDVHAYSNHEEQIALQRTREPFETPEIRFLPESVGKSILEISQADYEIIGYESHPHIAGKVAV